MIVKYLTSSEFEVCKIPMTQLEPMRDHILGEVDASQPPLSPVEVALLHNRCEGIIRAMMNTLRRTARSSILSTARDFSCAILTGDSQLLSVAESIPIHVFRGADLQAESMRQMHPDLRKGDAFLHNSPYHGNSHAADWSILVPVFDGDGIHRFTVLAKGHLADVGNSVPATRFQRARDVYEEGPLLFPCVKVQQDYQHNEDIIRMCKLRIRVPELWYGDYLAILGAARIGERLLTELIDERGPAILQSYVEKWLDYSEQRMIKAVAKMPAGSTVVRGKYDPVAGFPDGIPLNVRVTVDPTGGRIEVDLRDNIDCQPFGLNQSEATAATAGLIGIFSSLGDDVPTNAGSFRRAEVKLRENCIVGIPRHPTSCNMATTHIAERVAKFVAVGLAEIADGFGMAEVGCTLPAAWAKISGRDPRHGNRPFSDGIVLGTTHGAGAPKADGWLTLAGIGAAGTMLRDSIELDELKYPILVYEERLIADSEGAGRFRGAPGVHTEFGPIEGAAIEVIAGSDGTVFPARGVRGGGAGAAARQHKRDASGGLSGDLGGEFRITVGTGERIVSMCCGGGGYGPPCERDEDSVVHDVSEGWVTRERAREVYRVAVNEDGTLDPVATARLRETSAPALAQGR